ncbi:MAG: hypothetical protein ACXW20_22440, partial [Burkholderiales bacterium]
KPQHTAEEIAKAKPSATIELNETQVSLAVGGGVGRGTLHYGGKSYPFTIKGGGLAGVGVSKVHATGNVYFLNKLEDFSGVYSLVTAGATLGAGAGVSQYENNKGVFMAMISKTKGVDFNLGFGAVTIAIAK